MSNVHEHTVRNVPELRAALITKVPVYHFSAYWQTWSRVLDLSEVGNIRELALTPVNSQWMTSWTVDHCKGKVTEHTTNIFDRGHKVVTKLPMDIMQMLEKYNCLHLIDANLFSR